MPLRLPALEEDLDGLLAHGAHNRVDEYGRSLCPRRQAAGTWVCPAIANLAPPPSSHEPFAAIARAAGRSREAIRKMYAGARVRGNLSRVRFPPPPYSPQNAGFRSERFRDTILVSPRPASEGRLEVARVQVDVDVRGRADVGVAGEHLRELEVPVRRRNSVIAVCCLVHRPVGDPGPVYCIRLTSGASRSTRAACACPARSSPKGRRKARSRSSPGRARTRRGGAAVEDVSLKLESQATAVAPGELLGGPVRAPPRAAFRVPSLR
jgi:hypothetical protein